MQWRTPRDMASHGAAVAAWERGDFRDPRLQPRGSSIIADATWVRIPVSNPHPVDHTLHISLGASFLAFSEVYVETAKAFDLVLVESDRQPFGARVIQTPQLVSRVFTVGGESDAVIWIGLAVDGSSDIRLRLLTPEDRAREHLTLSNLQIAFYVSVFFIALFMLGFLFVYFSWAQFFYFAFFILLAAYNAQLSGLMFQWVWPNAPTWNAYASHYIGLAGIMCAAWAAWLFVVDGGPRHVFRYAVRAFLIMSVLAMVAPLFLPLVTVKVWVGPVVLLFLIIQFWGTFIAVLDRVTGRFILLAASVVLVTYLGVFTLGSQIAGLIPQYWLVALLHFGPLVDGMLRFSSTLLQSYRIKQNTEDAARRLEHMQSTLAAVWHDMRQPLGAMKMSLQGMEQHKDKEGFAQTVTELRESLSYLEGVIDVSGPSALTENDQPDEAANPEAAPVELYLKCMGRMFRREAGLAGITLRIVPSSANVLAPPLELTRIMSNLLHNAIKHSKGDKILLGVRQGPPGHIKICLADNGIGFEPRSEIPAAGRYAKRGNGLRIATELASASGIGLEFRSRKGGGTMVAITVPSVGS